MHAIIGYQIHALYPFPISLNSFNLSGKSANHFKSATNFDVIRTDKHPLFRKALLLL
jgi:hypothetical protein